MKAKADDATREKLLAVLGRHVDAGANDQAIPMETELNELGLDSLSAVNLLLDLEDAFGVSFPDSMLNDSTFRTAASLDDAIRQLVEDTG